MSRPPAPPKLIVSAQVLPAEARRILQAATAIPDRRARQFAIDAAIDRVKLLYPQHFRTPKE